MSNSTPIRQQVVRRSSVVSSENRNSALAGSQAGLSTAAVVAFVLLHAPLGIWIGDSPYVAMVHAYVVLLVGVWCALDIRRHQHLIAVVTYLAASEALWRTTYDGYALPVWEFGKSATVVILGIALLQDHKQRPHVPALAYLTLLLPSTVITLFSPTFSYGDLTFNLLGPMALGVCAWFFSNNSPTTASLDRAVLVGVAPILGIAAHATFGIATSVDLNFAAHSNVLTSGGWGPVQVSATLGMGAFLAVYFVMFGRGHSGLRVFIAALGVAFVAQSVMTFSRSGVYIAGGAAAVMLPFAVRVRGNLLRLGVAALALFFVLGYFVMPRLNEFTGGQLLTRFEDTGVTGRDQLIQEDLAIWKENFIFGVGPGRARRDLGNGSNITAHNEFSRMLSEHGLFGLAAIGLLISMALSSYRKTRLPMHRGFVAGAIAWSFLFMLSNGMRLLLPSIMFGICAGGVQVQRRNRAVAAPKGIGMPMLQRAKLQLSVRPANRA